MLTNVFFFSQLNTETNPSGIQSPTSYKPGCALVLNVHKWSACLLDTGSATCYRTTDTVFRHIYQVDVYM